MMTSGGHFQEVCEYGTVHGQCRCTGPKSIRTCVCPTPKVCAAKAETAEIGETSD